MFLKIGLRNDVEIFNKYKNSYDEYVLVSLTNTNNIGKKCLFTKSLLLDGISRALKNDEDVPHISLFNPIYNFITNYNKKYSTVLEIENTESTKRENPIYYYFKIFEPDRETTLCLMFTQREIAAAEELYYKYSDKL